jgi:hypothetical protein
MNNLFENPVAIWMGGAVCLTLALVVYWQVRNKASLAAIFVVLIATTVLLLLEHYIVTPREAVENTLYSLADAVEQNDMSRTLAFIAPGASKIRHDVETLMPQVTIDRANIVGTPRTTVALDQNPPTATVVCRGFVRGSVKRGGMNGGDFAEATITLIFDGQRWLVADYRSNKDWRGVMRQGHN